MREGTYMREKTITEIEEKFGGHILIDFLMLAVPFQIMRIKSGEVPLKFSDPFGFGKLLSEKGDVLLYGGEGAGNVAAMLVEAIATAAFVPGGITIFGLHFEETIPHEEINA